MVREGYYFGLPPVLIALLLFGARSPVSQATGGLLLFLGLFTFYFFRDPERLVPDTPGTVVSPADGRVVVVKDEPSEGRPGKRISIFLAIWNVHVNRAPAAGTIARLDYRPGKFMPAWAESASAENEQNIFVQSTEYGEIVYKQIAGWVARRVVSWKKQGDRVARGERIGLVRFGSRVDLWLPGEAEVLVSVGNHVKGGLSVLARFPETLSVRKDTTESRTTAQKKREADDRP
jgi:phosphatidylserine decarboxylase